MTYPQPSYPPPTSFTMPADQYTGGGGGGGMDQIYIKRFKDPETKIRLCQEPNNSPTQMKTYREHYSTRFKESFSCPNFADNGVPCVGCSDPDQKTRKRNRRFITNALNDRGELVLFKMGPDLHQKFINKRQRLGTVLNCDWIVVKSGTGLKTDYEPWPGEEYPVPMPTELIDIDQVLISSYNNVAAMYLSSPAPAGPPYGASPFVAPSDYSGQAPAYGAPAYSAPAGGFSSPAPAPGPQGQAQPTPVRPGRIEPAYVNGNGAAPAPDEAQAAHWPPSQQAAAAAAFTPPYPQPPAGYPQPPAGYPQAPPVTDPWSQQQQPGRPDPGPAPWESPQPPLGPPPTPVAPQPQSKAQAHAQQVADALGVNVGSTAPPQSQQASSAMGDEPPVFAGDPAAGQDKKPDDMTIKELKAWLSDPERDVEFPVNAARSRLIRMANEWLAANPPE